MLAEIQDGTYARRTGSRRTRRGARGSTRSAQREQKHRIEEVGARLRALMPFLKPVKTSAGRTGETVVAMASAHLVSGSVDLRQLEILRAIVESGSFTAAGERLHVSQSAISRQVLLLEEEFKEPLFLRFGRRIQITPTGEKLLQLSHRVFADIRDTTGEHPRSQEEADRHAAARRRHDGLPLRLPCPAAGLPAAASRRRHQGDHRRDAAAGAQAAVRRRRSRAVDAADRRSGTADGAGHRRRAAARHAGRACAGVRAARLRRRRWCVSRSSCSRRGRTRAAPSISSSCVPTSSRGSSPRPRTSRSSSRWWRRASASRSSPSRPWRRRSRGGTLRVARIEGERLVRETGWVHLRAERVPRMVQEMMDSLGHILPRLRLSPQANPVRAAKAR